MSGTALAAGGIVITGGSGHLGSAMVRRLTAEGARVVAIARGAERLDRLADDTPPSASRPATIVGDIREPGTVTRAVEMLDAEGIPLRGWVNNANTASSGGLLGNLDREGVQSAVGALADLMLITDEVAAAMIERGQAGSIVNISSMYGLVSPQPATYATHPHFHNPPAYGAVKAGILQFTRYAAVHLAPHGIRVNSVSPGPFPNPTVQEDRDFVAELEGRVPLGRIGLPDEVAGAVSYLLGDASTFTTGSNLVVDGGWSAW